MALNESDPRQPHTPGPAADTADDPLLTRAVEELRSEDIPAWVTVSEKITAALRNTARRGTPVEAHFRGAAREKDTVTVSDHVVRLAVVDAVSAHGATAERVDVLLEDGRYTGLVVGVAVDYGVEIAVVSDGVRERAAHAVATTLGMDVHPDTVDVEITDVIIPD